MYELKMLSKEAIPAALQKAERYRLLGEPYEAESICLDILQVEPDQQEALIMLLLLTMILSSCQPLGMSPPAIAGARLGKAESDIDIG